MWYLNLFLRLSTRLIEKSKNKLRSNDHLSYHITSNEEQVSSIKGERMKFLVVLLLAFFSTASFAQKNIDLTGKANLKICKAVESELASLSKHIHSLEERLKAILAGPRVHKNIVLKLQNEIAELKQRQAKLQAFYDKNCKKDVVDCDELKAQIAKLESIIIFKKDELTKLNSVLAVAVKKGDKVRINILKQKIEALSAELTVLSKKRASLLEIFKKQCE